MPPRKRSATQEILLSRFTLIYGNRQLKLPMFKEEVEDLKNR